MSYINNYNIYGKYSYMKSYIVSGIEMRTGVIHWYIQYEYFASYDDDDDDIMKEGGSLQVLDLEFSSAPVYRGYTVRAVELLSVLYDDEK